MAHSSLPPRLDYPRLFVSLLLAQRGDKLHFIFVMPEAAAGILDAPMLFAETTESQG
jgi:hypothetical protein